MRKRGKKRIPQDVKPWLQVKELAEDSLALPAKKTSRWVAGGRRDWNSRILAAAAKAEIGQLFDNFLTAGLYDSRGLFQQSALRKLSVSKLSSLGKYKNFCLYSGRGRTYSRSLHISRHNLRRLVSVGLVSGLVK